MFIQSINPAILLTSSMEALVTFLMYFTIENPDIKLMNELVVAKDIAEKSKNETINTLNKTGIVYAYQDKLTHVSVVPVGVSIQTWINAGSGSIWTQAVKSVVVKWDGGN